MTDFYVSHLIVCGESYWLAFSNCLLHPLYIS
jgi:hypothetical protein